MEKKTAKKGVSRLRPRHILLACAAFLVLLVPLVYSQQAKMGDIASEIQTLGDAHNDLLLEEQRLERMIEYAYTSDYLEQLAREKLGYVWPNDFKFYRE